MTSRYFSDLTLALMAFSLSPLGALPKKSVLAQMYWKFNPLNLSIPLSFLSCWAKPPLGEGTKHLPLSALLRGRAETGEGAGWA